MPAMSRLLKYEGIFMDEHNYWQLTAVIAQAAAGRAEAVCLAFALLWILCCSKRDSRYMMQIATATTSSTRAPPPEAAAIMMMFPEMPPDDSSSSWPRGAAVGTGGAEVAIGVGAAVGADVVGASVGADVVGDAVDGAGVVGTGVGGAGAAVGTEVSTGTCAAVLTTKDGSSTTMIETPSTLRPDE